MNTFAASYYTHLNYSWYIHGTPSTSRREANVTGELTLQLIWTFSVFFEVVEHTFEP